MEALPFTPVLSFGQWESKPIRRSVKKEGKLMKEKNGKKEEKEKGCSSKKKDFQWARPINQRGRVDRLELSGPKTKRS